MWYGISGISSVIFAWGYHGLDYNILAALAFPGAISLFVILIFAHFCNIAAMKTDSIGKNGINYVP